MTTRRATEAMRGVTITRDLVWRDDLRTVAPGKWSALIEAYRQFCKRNLPNDCRQLLRMITEGEAVEWAGFGDRDRYLRDGLDIDPEAVAWALRGLDIAGVEAPVPFREAQELGKRGRQADAPRDQAGRYLAAKGDNVTIGQRGNSRAYREAKAARDGRPADYYREKPLTVLRRAWKRASADERETFMREMSLTRLQ